MSTLFSCVYITHTEPTSFLQFGTVDLFRKVMLPPGAVHLAGRPGIGEHAIETLRSILSYGLCISDNSGQGREQGTENVTLSTGRTPWERSV